MASTAVGKAIKKWVVICDKLDIVGQTVSKTAGCVLKISYQAGKPVFRVLYNSVKVIPDFFPVSNSGKFYSFIIPLPQVNLKGGIEAFKEAIAKGEVKVERVLDEAGNIIVDEEGNILNKAITKEGEEVKLLEKVDGIEIMQASKLTGALKNTYDDLIKNGVKAIEDGGVIKLLDEKGIEIGILSESGLTPSKWLGTYKNQIISKTESGYWLIKSGEDYGFELGYKEGREFTAEYVNGYHKGIGHHEPYKQSTKVFERDLQPGDKIYIVEYKTPPGAKQIIPNPGGWGSKNKISTIKEVRNDLAILNDWKNAENGELVLREYTVKKELPVRDGVVGPLQEISGTGSGTIYTGNQHQYEFIENLRGDGWKEYLSVIDIEGTLLK